MSARKMRWLAPLIALVIFLSACTPAYALDKRLKLVFKTAGYGAAAGALLGGAAWLIGVGKGYRNVLMGASLGMYAGILLAGYVIFVPEEPDSPDRSNPFGPRKPVGPEDWKGEPEDDQGNLHRSDTPALVAHLGAGQVLAARPNPEVWVPVVSLSW